MKIVDEMPTEDGRFIRLCRFGNTLTAEELKIYRGTVQYYNDAYEEWLEEHTNSTAGALEVKYVVL